MIRLRRLGALVLWVGCVLCSSVLASQAPEGTVDWDSVDEAEIIPGELLVRFKNDGAKPDSIGQAVRVSVHESVGADLKRRFKFIPWDCVKVSAANRAELQEIAQRYLDNPNVAYVEPNYRIYPVDTVPNDAAYGTLWGMERINAPQAWDFTTGNDEIVVAVIDTGINLTHEDLVDNLWTNPGEIADDGIDNDGNGYVDDVQGWDFLNNDNDPSDDHGHGTHCAGTVGGVGNNGVGVVGVCWNVKMVGIKFLGQNGGSTEGAIASVEYATGLSQYIKLTSNSWGGGGASQALEAAIERAALAGQLFIAAAGNSNSDNDALPHYPSSYENENIIAVASIEESGNRSGFSCWGLTSVDLAAPGTDINSCWIGGNNQYNTISGTSMATPHVSGAAALLWSLNPSALWQDIEKAIIDNVASNTAMQGLVVTGGELDVFAAIQDMGANLKLDRVAYRSDATVNVEVNDSGADTNSPNVNIHWETTNTVGVLRAEDDVVLPGDGSGYRFTGSFTLVSGATNDAVHSDTLTVSYDPPNFDLLSVSVPIDDVPPVISNVEATNINDTSFLVRWTTDEPADSHIMVADALPLTGAPVQGSDDFVTTPTITATATQYQHSVLVTGLEPRTRHFVAVMSEDYAGNIATNPTDISSINWDDYLVAITRYRRTVKTIDFEDGDYGWTHSGRNDSWEYGLPTYGPPDTPFGSKGWGTDLDDRYDNLANASLVSGAMEIGYQSRVTMQMWYEIEPAYLDPYGQLIIKDQGFIELNDGSGWYNVTPNTDLFAGQTYIDGTLHFGWETVSLDLGAYEGKNVRLRYRLETDEGGVYAGWYIDDIELTEVQPFGVWVERVAIDDSAGGDGDGYPEPGETFLLSVFVEHYDGLTIYSQTVATVECPTDGVTTEFPTETIQYGDLGALVSTNGNRQPPVTVAADVADNTVASFLYSITSTTPENNPPWEGEFSITLGVRESRTGVITNIVGGAPIGGATVIGTAAGYADITATSEADGSYILNGLVSGVTYQVTACKTNEFSHSMPVGVSGAGVFNIGLGKAYGTPSPAFVLESVDEGETGLITRDIVFDNSAGTVDYVYEADVSYITFFNTGDGWMELSSMTGTVAAGTMQTNTLVFDLSGLDPDLYIATVTLEGNDISCDDVEVPVWLDFANAPILDLVAVNVGGGDGDPFVEPGETNTLSLVLQNRGSDSSTSTTGLLMTASGLTIESGVAEWPTIDPHPALGSLQASSTDPIIAVGASADGTVYPLSLEVTSLEGSWQFTFSVTTMVRQAVSGQVTDGVTLNPVSGCLVKAHGPAGVESTARTDGTGAYTLYGLTNANYTIAVIPPSNYDSPGTEAVTIAGADVAGVDFTLEPWDLTLSPASFNKTVYEGEDTTDVLEVGKLSAGGGYVEFDVEQTGDIPPVVPDQVGPAIDWTSLTAEDYAPGQVFVTFNNSVGMQAQSSVLASQGLTVARRYTLTDAVLVDLPRGASVAQVAGILTANASVAHVEPNYRYDPFYTPNDVRFDELYGLHNTRQTGGSLDSDIDAPEAWDITTGDTNIIVAVIDTGVELQHEDLQGQCVQGFDFGALTTEWIIPNADGVVSNFAGTLMTPPIAPGSMVVKAIFSTNAAETVITLIDDGENNLTSTFGAVPPHGTIDYTTGAWTLNFEETPPVGFVTATFTDSDPTPDYDFGLGLGVDHGTHVAGTVAAAGDNTLGVVGVAYNTKIMPLKASTNILSFVGFVPVFYQDALLASLDYAVLHGARVSNHSYGGTSFSPVMRSAFSNAMAYGHIAVCAAGNEGADADNPAVTAYPAGYNLPNIISVAAMDHNDTIASFSNYGANNVDVGAPGVNILSCTASFFQPSDYDAKSGTSMASPHVAGIMGLLASSAPNAPWDALVQALFDGVRPDPNLEGVVHYAGHANALGALQKLRPFWLSLDPDYASIPAGGTATNTVTFNTGKHLTAGTYDANIVVSSGSNSTNVPVALTVLPAPRPAIGEIFVAGGDGDGIAEPNETVQIQVALTNEGSAFVLSPTGMLATAGGTVLSGQMAWNSLQIGGSSAPTVSPTVQFGAVVASPVPFTLTVGDNPASGRGPWDLTFELDVVAANSISGSVRNTSGTYLGGVPIEYWGVAAGTSVTDVAGTFWIHGLPTNGTVKVRPLPDTYAKTTHQTWDLSLGNGAMSFVVSQPTASFSKDTITAAVQHGLSTTASFMVNNTATDALDYQCLEMPARRVALISDGMQLNSLSNVLASFGVEVSVYSNNYEIVYTPDPNAPGQWSGDPTTYFSSDDAIVYGHDLVIADLSGTHGAGRVFTTTEEEIFEHYLNRGGKLIVTGANPLSSPDSRELMELVGATTLDQLSVAATDAVMTDTLPTERFVNIDVGDKLASAALHYDLATPAPFGEVTTYFKADASSKLMRRTVVNENATGQLYYWAGNQSAADWSNRGAWQDVLKDIVVNELAMDVSWVSVAGASNSVATGSRVVNLTLNNDGDLDVGTNKATIVVLGNYPGEDARAVQVELDVAPVTLEAISSAGVTNWLGEFITGDGTLDSSLFQVVWAGPDGAIDPPALDGSATGDDQVLARYPSGEAYGRFGIGYEATPDRGLFDEVFAHGLTPTSSSRTVYVRAWDAATIGTSVAYGNSALYMVTNEAYETHDFGVWGATVVPGYPGGGKDTNGDSIPDGWYVLNGLDPRAAIVGLTSAGTHQSKFGVNGSGDGQFNLPSRLFLTDAFIFVLDRGNNRIQVWNRASETFVRAYTPSPTLGQARGMAKDPRSGIYRFAVADTGNHVVRTFTYNPTTGVIAEDFTIGGSKGSADGLLDNPAGVAIDLFGYIYVADTGNDRIQVFTDTGAYSRKFGGYGVTAGLFDGPKGICVTSAGTVYVADTGNNRIQLLNGWTGAPMFEFGTGGDGDGQFDQPTDVQIGIADRIFVMDSNNHRAQVFLQDGASFNHILTFGEGGSGDGQLLIPFGLAPVPTSGSVYVADTYNHRVVQFDTIIDTDADGMDDEWESDNGITDALGDADGDGILNIGEYRLMSGVNTADSDGDEWSDGYEIWRGLDPLDPQYDLLRMTSIAEVPSLELHYMGEAGKTYRIETTTDLEGGVWVPVPSSSIVPGSDGIITFTPVVAPGDPNRFYRAVRIDN